MWHLRVALAVLLFTVPNLAAAEQVVANDATSIANFFLNEGLKPRVERDSVGDPKIKINYYGTEFVIYYYGCTDGENCDSIQFFSGYRTEGSIRLSAVNEWNVSQRFGYAYISDTGNARIEHDVFLGDIGMDADDFAKLVNRWTRAVKGFESHIDW